MARWSEVEQQAPELTAEAKVLFDAFTHKTLATIRRDGSPRISGTELEFLEDGDLRIGSMWRSMKALDLQRDPRYALHSGSPDPDTWRGDAKLAGRVEELEPHQGENEPSHVFRLDITELVVVRLGEPADHILIESWHEGRGLNTVIRR